MAAKFGVAGSGTCVSSYASGSSLWHLVYIYIYVYIVKLVLATSMLSCVLELQVKGPKVPRKRILIPNKNHNNSKITMAAVKSPIHNY